MTSGKNIMPHPRGTKFSIVKMINRIKAYSPYPSGISRRAAIAEKIKNNQLTFHHGVSHQADSFEELLGDSFGEGADVVCQGNKFRPSHEQLYKHKNIHNESNNSSRNASRGAKDELAKAANNSGKAGAQEAPNTVSTDIDMDPG